MVSTKYFTFRNLYLLGFCALFYSLSVSLFVLSISQMFLGLVWLVEKNYKTKLNRVKQNKFFWIISSLFFLHVIGLAYTTDFNYGLNDLRIKLPILLIPFFFASISPIKPNEFKVLMCFFIAGLITSLSFSYYDFLQLKNIPNFDPREASRFINHIRLSLMLAFAVLYLLIETNKQKGRPIIQFVLLVLTICFLVYMIQLQMLTGIVALVISGVIAVEAWLMRQEKQSFKAVAILLPFVLIIGAGCYIYSSVSTFIFPNKVLAMSKETRTTVIGNPYSFNTQNLQLENGNLVWAFVNEAELQEEWNKKSDIEYRGLDKVGQPLRSTLIRYLTSKNLHKDSQGISQLNRKDVIAIENGTTNYLFVDNIGISKRIYEIGWELHNYLVNNGDPSGNSVAQRLEFWRVASKVIKENLLFGVGTGDIVWELENYYESSATNLNKKSRLKPHNQYITTLICFGLFGFLLFTYILFKMVKQSIKSQIALVFFSIIIISMFTEDTLETQVGATLFALFSSVFVIENSNKKEMITQ